MRLTVRHRGATEIDHELIWLSISLGGLGLAAIWFALQLPWPHCMFLAITGHPCLTCGATRSAIAFFHLDFWSALKWNPLFFTVLCGLSIFDAYAFAILVARAPRVRIIQITTTEKSLLRLVAILVLISNWIYLLSRSRGLF